MKKYFFNDGISQQGPFTLEELKTKSITAETPVWYDGLPDWTTARQVEELKDIIVHTPPPFHAVVVPPVEEVKAATPVTTTTTQPVAVATTAMATAAPAKSAKKSTAWLSYVLALLVFGGVGYYVYLDMEKNKGNDSNVTATTQATDSTVNATDSKIQEPAVEQSAISTPGNTDTVGAEVTTTEPATATTTVATATTPPATVTTSKTTVPPAITKPDAATIKAQKAEAQKLALKKIEDDKKKLQAAQAAAALKEKEYRNNWPKYISFGKLDYKDNGSGIDAFNVPVYNGTNAMLDKVTVRIDYMKNDRKVIKSETIDIYNIPPGSGLNGKAPESKKGNNVKVFFTGITSRKLHFCFPVNNGNAADPYFCN